MNLPGAPDVLVVGVANVDLVTRVPRLPGPGETVFGVGLAVLPGGKGLNQALAVTRSGGTAALAATAGDDVWGRLLHRTLRDAGVDTSAFILAEGGTTAAVMVQVPPGGDSALTVTRTPTTFISLAELAIASPLLESSAATVIQLELDPDVVAQAVARAAGRKIGMLVPDSPMSGDIMSALDVIVVNRSEAAAFLGGGPPVEDVRDGHSAAEALRRLGPAAAVVTLGPQGAVYAGEAGTGHVPAPVAAAVDTAGAGDAFLGAFALGIVRTNDLAEAVRRGVGAGTAAVGHFGAAVRR